MVWWINSHHSIILLTFWMKTIFRISEIDFWEYKCWDKCGWEDFWYACLSNIDGGHLKKPLSPTPVRWSLTNSQFHISTLSVSFDPRGVLPWDAIYFMPFPFPPDQQIFEGAKADVLLSMLDYPSYIFSVSFVFSNSLLFCVISTVQWSGATSICDGII